MKNATVFLGLCVVFTAVLAVPQNARNSKNTQNLDRGVDSKDMQIKSAILLRNLSSFETRDYFSDLILAVLKMSVKELLSEVEKSFKSLDSVTREKIDCLNALITSADPNIQLKIKALVNDAINEIFETTGPFLADLGLVLPVISSVFHPFDSAADIIRGLLGITLEDLIIAIANSMDRLLTLLTKTIKEMKEIAKEANGSTGSALIEISDTYLLQGTSAIVPIRDKLRQIVSPDRGHNAIGNENLLDATVSNILGTNVHIAASQAEESLKQVINVLESTRKELSTVFDDIQTEEGEVQAQVMKIYDDAIDDVIRVAKPFFEILLQFQGSTRHDKQFIYNVLTSLFGIGFEEFQEYIRIASSRVNVSLEQSHSSIISLAFTCGGVGKVTEVSRLFSEKRTLVETYGEPVIQILKTILGQQSDSNVTSDQDEWSNPDNGLYNRKSLILQVSKALQIEVPQAVKTLETTLENLDVLMEESVTELDLILMDSQNDVRPDIHQIVNQTLTEIHITLQPMIDVLLPFLPDRIRSNRDIAFDILNGINEVNVQKFRDYCSWAAKHTQQTTNLAMAKIHVAATPAGQVAQEKVEKLLKTTDKLTQTIIKPFIEIVEPIITPRH